MNSINRFIVCAYLTPLPVLSVSMGWWRSRAGAGPAPVGPAGLLAPGLLLGPTLHRLIPLRVRCTRTLAWVS